MSGVGITGCRSGRPGSKVSVCTRSARLPDDGQNAQVPRTDRRLRTGTPGSGLRNGTGATNLESGNPIAGVSACGGVSAVESQPRKQTEGPVLMDRPRGKGIWRRPTLPPLRSGSTLGAVGLNCRVRDGNGCVPHAIATRKLSAPPPRGCAEDYRADALLTERQCDQARSSLLAVAVEALASFSPMLGLLRPSGSPR